MEARRHLMILRNSLVINVGAITRIKFFGALNVIGEGIVRTVFQHGERNYHLRVLFIYFNNNHYL